ncbi:MAG: hypothetical protein K2L42_06545 [Clostridia bacterium]|nr:hypothetical protein [Clostridia bacterium]
MIKINALTLRQAQRYSDYKKFRFRPIVNQHGIGQVIKTIFYNIFHRNCFIAHMNFTAIEIIFQKRQNRTDFLKAILITAFITTFLYSPICPQTAHVINIYL